MKKLLYIKDSEQFWKVFNDERKKTRERLAQLPFAEKIEIMSKMRERCPRPPRADAVAINIPDCDEFHMRCKEFKKRERREAMYNVATFLINHFWGKPKQMADALGVLLLTWNQAFYRYGRFDFDRLEQRIADHLSQLEAFRKRSIFTFSKGDDKRVAVLFDAFLKALEIVSDNKMNGKQSPVAVAKALHLLAPDFFPLWDNKIARAYGCHYANDPRGSYISFCYKMKLLAEKVRNYVSSPEKSLVKLIDEYNYARHTKGWIGAE